MEQDIFVIKVSSSSESSKVATAIVRAVNEKKKVEISTIGAGALNQAIKACIIASGILAQQGITLFFKPGFFLINDFVEKDGTKTEKTAIKIIVITQ